MHAARLMARAPAGGDLILVTLVPPPELVTRYVCPGQYLDVRVRRDDEEVSGYFVLASVPGAFEWELLVRNAGDAADLLSRQPLGSEVLVSPPLGGGFPLDRVRHRPLTIAVVGSGIGVARPLVTSRLRDHDGARTSVYFGLRAARELPLERELGQWIDQGVRIVLCLSRGELDDDAHVLRAAARQEGYVQSVVEREPRSALGTVFAVGPEAMLADMRALAIRPGEPPLEVVTNV